MSLKRKRSCRIIQCLLVVFIKWSSASQAQSPLLYASNAGSWDDRFDALGLNGPAYAIAVHGRDVYVGGNFTRAGEVFANNLARWDGSNWHALGNGIPSPGATAIVYAVAVAADGKLYAGGQFAAAGNTDANNIAVWNGSDWASLGSMGARGTNSTVYALAVRGNEVFAGGIFTFAGDISANGVARWNGAQWSRLGTTLTNGVTGGAAYAVSVFNDWLFVGGDFANAGGMPAENIARWSTVTGTWSAFGQGVDGRVQSIAGNFFGEVVVGGIFSFAAGIPANRVAKWNGSTWSSLGTGQANGVTGEVRALAASADYLYVGGDFFEAGGGMASNIARWDRNNWATLGSGVAGVVHALAYDSAGAVLVGGQFLGTGGKSARNFGIWHEDTNPVDERNKASQIQTFELRQNYPNPFNPATEISYFLPSAQFVSVQIFDLNGQEIVTLVHGWQNAGEQHLRFDAQALSAGVYFYSFASGAFRQTRKMVLLR